MAKLQLQYPPKFVERMKTAFEHQISSVVLKALQDGESIERVDESPVHNLLKERELDYTLRGREVVELIEKGDIAWLREIAVMRRDREKTRSELIRDWHKLFAIAYRQVCYCEDAKTAEIAVGGAVA